MTGIVFEQVTKKYENGFEAVKNLNLEIGEEAVSYTHLTLPTTPYV